MTNHGTFTLLILGSAMIIGLVVVPATGSAIPMWEFLSRDEKMSHLFRVFSKQVAGYCSDSPRPDCNKNLLVTGVRSLAGMDDNLLDQLDPYQRDAKEMIWHAMVGTARFSSRVGHEADDSFFTTGADPLATSGSETNGLGDDSSSSGDNYVRQSSSMEHTGPYLVGPMVIRVYPDGRPVPEDSSRPLPRDEDADELRYVRLPSIEEIEASGSGSGSDSGSFYGKQKESFKRGGPYQTNRRRQTIETGRLRTGSSGLHFKKRLLQDVTDRRVHYY